MCTFITIIIIIVLVIGGIAQGEEEAKKKKQVSPPLSPLEEALEKIKPGAYGRAKKLAMYVVPLYTKPYADFGGYSHCASINSIVSKYIDNQLLFSEEYENHVIDLSGTVETIGKEDETVYISIGDGSYYYRSGRSGEGVKQLIECQIYKKDMEDINYKNLILNMRPGAEVTLVGVLLKEKYGGFKLSSARLIESNGVAPDFIMGIAKSSIYKKYEELKDN